MKIRLYIVTYKRNEVLNRNLASLWRATHDPSELEVTVLANHPEVAIDSVNVRGNLRLLLNHTRPANAWGYLARDWNFGLLDAFGTWQNPRTTPWCVLAQNDVEWLDGWDDFLRQETRFDLISQERGDQAVAVRIEALRRVGFFDERFCTLHFHEYDYFLRSMLILGERASINDDHPPFTPEEASFNRIGPVLTAPTHLGFCDEGNLHTTRSWRELRNLLYHKWGVTTHETCTHKLRFLEHVQSSGLPLPREVDWYPFFWQDMPERPHALLADYEDLPPPPEPEPEPPPPPPPPPEPYFIKLRRKLARSIKKRVDRYVFQES